MYQFSSNLDTLNKIGHKASLGIAKNAKFPCSTCASVSKQTSLASVDDGPPKLPICESVYEEGMKDISNIKVHLKTQT